VYIFAEIFNIRLWHICVHSVIVNVSIDRNGYFRLQPMHVQTHLNSWAIPIAMCLWIDIINDIIWLNYYRIRPSLRHSVYCTAIEHGSNEDWYILVNQYNNETHSIEKDRIFSGLTCSPNIWMINRFRICSINWYLSMIIDYWMIHSLAICHEIRMSKCDCMNWQKDQLAVACYGNMCKHIGLKSMIGNQYNIQ